MADAGQTPSTDQTLADQPLEDRTDMVDKSRVERHAPGGLGPARHVVPVGHHIRMEKKQIEPRQSEASKAPFDRLPQAISSRDGLPRPHLLVTCTPSGRWPPK